ncbi:DUF7313 family protein [Haloprofundus halophilus]|uniref:DUF7313 family protein n=1 Tax=Haloprofundus halophilus TaxID=2283527 RepID=UPI000E44C0D5|nr:hypothetical protein [Haloprofundus halophilus]
MQPLQFIVPLDVLEAIAPALPAVILVFVLANMATRFLGHRAHARQAREDEEITRYTPHTLTSGALVVASLLYLVVAPHGGMVMSVLVLGMFVTDFFEFEARQVEARNGMDVERPKGGLAASVLVLLYAAFQSLFFLIADVWTQII